MARADAVARGAVRRVGPVQEGWRPLTFAPGASGEVTVTQLRSRIAALEAEIARLRAGQPAGVPQPAIVDMIGKLATHPTLPPYTTRTRPITMIAWFPPILSNTSRRCKKRIPATGRSCYA